MNRVVELSVEPVYTLVRFVGEWPRFDKNQVAVRLREVMRARIPNYRWHPRVQARRWDGYIYLYKNGKFPSGLLDIALQVLEDAAEDLEYDLRLNECEYPIIPLHTLNSSILRGKVLRDYQLQAAKELLRNKRGIGEMATNSGKTIVFSAMISTIGGNVVIMLHKKDLMYQTAQVVEETTGIPVGIVGDGYTNLGEPVTVAMMQTLSNILGTEKFSDFAKSQDALFIDECHHTSAKTMMDIVMRIPAPLRFGFSGTPLTHNELKDLQLIGATGPVRVTVSNEELIEAGYSAKPLIKMLEIQNPPVVAETWQEAYNLMIVNNEERNRLIAAEASGAVEDGKVVLILVKRLKHQNVLADMLYDSGFYHYNVANGGDNMEHRTLVLDRMREGIPEITIATDIFGEGVDVPALDMLINAGGYKSHIDLLQKVGRALRRKEGENVVGIVDFYDKGNRYLEKHSEQRLKIYRGEGFNVETSPSP